MEPSGDGAAQRRYEFRIVGRLSERTRSAFGGMEVREVPAETVIAGELSEDGGQLTYEFDAKADRTGYTKRHILRYIKMHDLIQPLKDRLDAQFPRTVTLMAGYWLAFLPGDEQELVAALDAPISEEKAKKLRELSVSGELTENAVREILRPKREVPKLDFRALNRQIRKAAAEQLRPEYLPQAGKIFAQALGEYLDRHPEYRR